MILRKIVTRSLVKHLEKHNMMKHNYRISLLASLLTAVCCLSGVDVMAFVWNGGTYYFDNTTTQWKEVYMRVGHSSSACSYPMKKMAGNSNIYSATIPKWNDEVTGYQFAEDGTHNSNLYDGNNIAAEKKSVYLYSNDVGYYLYVPTDLDNDKYWRLEYAQMPSALSISYVKVVRSDKDQWYAASGTQDATHPSFVGADLGVFGTDITIAGDVNATSTVTSSVSATMNYCKEYTSSSSKYTSLNMAANSSNKAKKELANTSIKVPSAAGEYTLSLYFQCGNVYDNNGGKNFNAKYTVPGLTGSGATFGSVMMNSGVESKSLTVSNVWGATEVTATLASGDFWFDAGGTHKTTSVGITNHKGSFTVYFKPTGSTGGTRSAELTLSFSYTDTRYGTRSVSKSYYVTGYAKVGNPVCHIGQSAVLSAGPKATMYGHLQATGCQTLVNCGFVYTTNGSTPGKSSSKWGETSASSLSAGDNWSFKNASNLTVSTTYKYRAYVTTGSGVDNMYLSDEIGEFTPNNADCGYYDFSGDEIYITVDNSLTTSVPCELKYKNLKEALGDVSGVKGIKNFSELYNSATSNLNKNIVIEVVSNLNSDGTPKKYTGNTTLGYATGGTSNSNSLNTAPGNAITQINTGTGNNSPTKWLTIRAKSEKNMPVIRHIAIFQCKNIRLQYLQIEGDASTQYRTGAYETGLDINNYTVGYNSVPNWTEAGTRIGSNGDAGIEVTNCKITSSGFAGVHIARYSGVYFEDNEFILKNANDDNTTDWGASFKIMNSDHIKFLRNDFTGAHATSMWLQNIQNMLVMNNVFWNNNSAKSNTSFICLVVQDKTGTVEKCGFYYNTMYLAEKPSGVTKTSTKVDFFRIGSKSTQDLSYVKPATVHFMYNNCYSYDENNIDGKSEGVLVTEASWCSSINYNNFWSKYDEKNTSTTVSVFNVPDDCSTAQRYVNVENIVCSESVDPASLVIKGPDLNVGSAISNDVSEMGANEIYNDRTHPSNGADAVRKTNGEWTLGAYQQAERGGSSNRATKILWWGEVDNDWDNRSNWQILNEDGTTTRLTCANDLDMDLIAIIPAPSNSQYPLPVNPVTQEVGVKNYPVIPSKFRGARTNVYSEGVNAGQGISPVVDMYASKLEIEYGGVLKNVQSLKDDEGRHYTDAKNYFTAGRNEWILVGTVVMPFDEDDNTKVRYVKSKDYYLYQFPHVYMHKAQMGTDVSGNPIFSWDYPFADLEIPVKENEVFAIKVPDQYGPNKLPASVYYKYRDNSMLTDGGVEKTFKPFEGRFLNEGVEPEYQIVDNSPIMLPNTLPANIKAYKAGYDNSGWVYIYDYEYKNVSIVDDPSDEREIKSQHGFFFVPTDGNDGWFRVTNDMLSDNSTAYKSAGVVNPYYSIGVLNSNGDGGSMAKVVLDELKADEYVKDMDLLNMVNASAPTQPEISFPRYEREFDNLVLPTFDEAIPLKLVVPVNMTAVFKTYRMYNVDYAVLVDRETGKEYNLLEGEDCRIELAKGTYIGRFYLNLSQSDDIPTVIDEDVVVNADDIDIYSNGKDVIISSTPRVELVEAYITDMSGRMSRYKFKDAHHNRMVLNGMKGVYIIKAVGDNMSKTEKVIVK